MTKTEYQMRMDDCSEFEIRAAKIHQYSFAELIRNVRRNPSELNLMLLGYWFERYDSYFSWNGEYFDTHHELNGQNLYPVYEKMDDDSYELVGYELR